MNKERMKLQIFLTLISQSIQNEENKDKAEKKQQTEGMATASIFTGSAFISTALAWTDFSALFKGSYKLKSYIFVV